MRAGLLLAAAALAGCAWGPGAGFGTIVPGAVAAGVSLPAGRADGAGGWKTDNGYLVRLDGPVAVEVGEVDLQAPAAAAAAGSGAVFDPAKPPAGYSLCHNGHCHRNDGALIDYADVQAELAAGGGGAAAPATIAALRPRVASLALVPGTPGAIDFDRCAPDCDLPAGAISRAPLRLARIVAMGRTTSQPGIDPLPGDGVAWRLTLAEGLTLAGPLLKLTAGRQGPPSYRFGGELSLSERLFDGIDWARLAGAAGTAAAQLDADAATREALLANFARSTWVPALTPQP